MSERARITLPDLAFIAFGLAFMGALAPVFYDVLNAHASGMSTGEAYIYQLVYPLLAVVFLAVVYTKAIRGVER